jgi:putative phosphoesterase
MVAELLLGIISDSHDNLPKINQAISKLNSLGVDQVLHAGDYCAPFAALPYKALKAKMHGVFGNNDAEREKLQEKFQAMGHDVKGSFAHLEVDGTRIALLHGDDDDLLQALTKTQAYDLVVFGHTHAVSQLQKGKTILLNPGEICGYLSGKSTIATFDVASHRIEILEI